MKTFLSALCTCCLCCLIILAFAITPADARTNIVCICHHPPGNPTNAHTICIGEPAVRAHQRHGDTIGECPVTCDSNSDCGANKFCKRDEGECAEGAVGVCAPRISPCPTNIDPVCGCDGTTYNNACEANAAGVTVASAGACQGAACGGAAGDTCSDTQFCKTDLGVCDANAEGECIDIPVSCSTEVNPVCGCDGVTYPNACTADGAGVNIAATGECAGGGGAACGGAAGDTCADTEFCKLETGACSQDAEGVCTPIPGACTVSFIPVCGCDGVTYSNACFAASAGASIAADGVCPQGAACVVGGGTCAAGEFCRPAIGACGASADGHCTTIPEVCPPPISNIQVCGCDGVTYDNACLAFAAGFGIASVGECEADQQACGGAAGTCGTGEVCIRPAGECADDAEGVCQPVPAACTSNIAPVCGCDGVSYSNACVANAAGVTVDHEGECGQAVACDGTTGVTCPGGQFCKHADGACGVENEGVCTDTPLTCKPVDEPVCACIGVGFPNACYANAVGYNIANTGVCGAPGACDGATGVTCPSGQFCKHPDGACAADVEGVCTDTPLTCDPIDDPVCACGGIGFPNACYANAVGFNLENTGACVDSVACDGATGVNCGPTEFCKHPDGACGTENQGVCTERPLTCAPIDSKVCACGEIGFPNACYANAVGLNIENTGVCTPGFRSLR